MNRMDYLTESGRAQAQSLIDEAATHGVSAEISLVWRDYGAEWGWETISYHSRKLNMSCQLLSPREWEQLNYTLLSEDTRRDILQRMMS